MKKKKPAIKSKKVYKKRPVAKKVTPKTAKKKVTKKIQVKNKASKLVKKTFKKINKAKSRKLSTSRAPVEKKPQRLMVVEGGKKTSAPLVIEPYPRDYTGLPFLTLIQFRKQPMLVIVDNVDSVSIKAYVLDLCGPEGVDEEKVILTASEWYASRPSVYPVSIEFSKRGMTAQTSRIYRTFDVEFVSRVIGPAPEFPMGSVKSVKRRRRKAVPPGIEIVKQGNVIQFDQFFTA